jgi:hypothetical protein
VKLSLAPVFAGSLDAADISLPRDQIMGVSDGVNPRKNDGDIRRSKKKGPVWPLGG